MILKEKEKVLIYWERGEFKLKSKQNLQEKEIFIKKRK